LTTVPPVSANALLAEMPDPWKTPIDRPANDDNGFLRFKDYLNRVKPPTLTAIPGVGIEDKAALGNTIP
jgi:hypothetical protein